MTQIALPTSAKTARLIQAGNAGASSSGRQQASMQFSVVIATHNRATELARCLTALGLIEFPRDKFEVVIVNDGGTIAPAAALQALAPGLSIRILTQRNAGPGAARNTGANAANGEFVAFIDDDCIPPRDW